VFPIIPESENPIFGGINVMSASEGGTVTLGATVSAVDSDHTRGTVTIPGLSNDLSNLRLSAGTYTVVTCTWTGTAAQFNGLSVTAEEPALRPGTTNESYTLTINAHAEAPIISGSTSGTVSEGGTISLGATVSAVDSDDTLGTVTITGLSNDLSNFNAGSYTAASGTWTRTAAQFNALSFSAAEKQTEALTITATSNGAEPGITNESYTLTINATRKLPSSSVAPRRPLAKAVRLASAQLLRRSIAMMRLAPSPYRFYPGCYSRSHQ
jgi:muramidase (phage lysozyme)